MLDIIGSVLLFDRFLRIDDRSCALIEAKPNLSRAAFNIPTITRCNARQRRIIRGATAHAVRLSRSPTARTMFEIADRDPSAQGGHSRRLAGADRCPDASEAWHRGRSANGRNAAGSAAHENSDMDERAARSWSSAAGRRASRPRWPPSSRTPRPRSCCSATSTASPTRSRRCRRRCSPARRCRMTRRSPARRASPAAASRSSSARACRRSIAARARW